MMNFDNDVYRKKNPFVFKWTDLSYTDAVENRSYLLLRKNSMVTFSIRFHVLLLTTSVVSVGISNWK